jgi:predicted dehydrogenase
MSGPRRVFGIGLIGTGFMGQAHALAFREAPVVFPDGPGTRLEMVADLDPAAAARTAERFGFSRSTGDWRSLVADPRIDVVAIATPNFLHKEMTLAALRAGKAVYCEKPMAPTLDDAREMAAAADEVGMPGLVGYNYLRSPAVALAARLVEEGVIGTVTFFRGLAEEDYMADAGTPFSWRCRRDIAGSGALGDLGSHAIGLALRLAGPVERVVADLDTVVPARPAPPEGELRERRDGTGGMASGPPRAVENEDIAQCLLRFASGVCGQITASRVAWGRKNRLAFEVHGTRGSIAFDQERMNELALFTAGSGRAEHNGFRTILTGPGHPPYGAFLPAAGHGLGYNHLKTVEVAHLLAGLAGTAEFFPTFRDALEVEKVLSAVLRSAAQGRWVALAEL